MKLGSTSPGNEGFSYSRLSSEPQDKENNLPASIADSTEAMYHPPDPPSTSLIDLLAENRRLRQINLQLRQQLEQQQVDQNLQLATSQLAGILAMTSDAILGLDSQQRITLFNRGAEAIFGYQEAEILGRPLDILIPRRYVIQHRQHVENFKQAPEMARYMEKRTEVIGMRKDGREFPAEVSISKLQVGEHWLFTAVVRDVTERQKTEALLRAQSADLERQVSQRTAQLQQASEFEKTLKQITDRVRDSLDENHILQTAVQDLATALGSNCCYTSSYNLEEQTATIRYEHTNLFCRLRGHIVQMADLPEIYRQLLQHQAFQFCSLDLPLLHGRAAILCVPIFDDQGTLGDLWLINQSYQDFSYPAFPDLAVRLVQQVANQCAIALRQSRLYQTTQQEVVALERLNQLKDSFLSTISHELRTPMSSISMAVQMLDLLLKQNGILSTAADPSPELEATEQVQPFKPIQRYMKMLKNACQREINLINDLLDLNEMSAGKQPLNLSTQRLQTWLPQILEGFQPRIQAQNQQLQLEVPAELPPVTTDFTVFHRVVFELLTNACKFTPTGGLISVRVNGIYPTAMTDREPLAFPLSLSLLAFCLSVSNSGVEIPASEYDRIFDKFYRLPHLETWKYPGTGIGLALVKRRVAHLKGKVQVTSGDNQTMFTVQISQAQP